jgi:hypothetical protein
MKQTLYNCHDAGDQYRITKFVDGDVESSYICTHTECDCPAGIRPSCRHRQMLPQMLAANIVNSHYFWHFDYGCAVDIHGTTKALLDNLAASRELAVPEIGNTEPKSEPLPSLPDGVQAFGMDDLFGIHNAIAEAVGEPEAKLAADAVVGTSPSALSSWRRI